LKPITNDEGVSKVHIQCPVLCLWFNTLCPGDYMTLVLYNRDVDVDSSQGNSVLIMLELAADVHTKEGIIQTEMVLCQLRHSTTQV